MRPQRRAWPVVLLLLLLAGCATAPRIADKGIGGTGLDLGGGLVVQPDALRADKGIGGTGITGDDPALADKGIGGTGIVGTVTGFGSIFVNGIEAMLGRDTIVTIDGAASEAALSLGQIVRIEAEGTGSVVQSRRIDIVHEVVGPVAGIATDGASLVVLGQTVALPNGLAAPKAGDWVAVSGLRRLDGTIVASRLDQAAAGAALVAGPVVRLASGASAIGALPLAGAGDALPPGRRAIVSGLAQNGTLAVARAALEPIVPFDGRFGLLSLETYVRLPSGTSQRAILDLVVRPGGLALRHATFPATQPALPPPAAPRPPAVTPAPASEAAPPASGNATRGPPAATSATSAPAPLPTTAAPAAAPPQVAPAPSQAPLAPAVPRPLPPPPPPPPPPRR
jgi:hypothetical protein